MPDKTADALARILSLSTSAVNPAVAAGADADNAPELADRPAGGPAGGPEAEAASGLGREPSPELQSSLFFDFGESVHEVSAAAGVRPRFDSKVRASRASWQRMLHWAGLPCRGPCVPLCPHAATLWFQSREPDSEPEENEAASGAWNAGYAHQLLETEDALHAPFDAHGPDNYGAPHSDPYGPADRDSELGPMGPPLLNDDPGDSSNAFKTEARGLPPPGAGCGPAAEENVAAYSTMPSYSSRHEHAPRVAACGEASGQWNTYLYRHPDGEQLHVKHTAAKASSGKPFQPDPALWQDQYQLPLFHSQFGRHESYGSGGAAAGGFAAAACGPAGQRGVSDWSDVVPDRPVPAKSVNAFDVLPRECVVVLLQNALQRLPQDAHVVERCMRTLGPLSQEEHFRCFPPARTAGAGGAGAGARVSSALPGAAKLASMEAMAVSRTLPADAGKMMHKEAWAADAKPGPARVRLDGESKARLPGVAKQEEDSRPAVVKAGGGAAAGSRTGSKEAVELLRTDTGRAGARTSILTEAQAVEVFKLRPAIRSERASLCAELADRYRVTTTAIRHIWDRRTWVWTNMPHWTGVCVCEREREREREMPHWTGVRETETERRRERGERNY